MSSLSPVNAPQVQTETLEAATADERRLPTLRDLDDLVADLDELDRRLADVDD